MSSTMDTKKTYNQKGKDYLDLLPDRLQIEEICNCVKSPDCGAISMFIGTTRDNFDGLKVVSLHYEAYKSMALKILKDICNNLRETWPDIVNIAIYHRLGNVPVSEASVVIAVSSPHRQSSLSAVEHAINKLKEMAPIWKKEEYSEGQSESQWKENNESRQTDQEDDLITPDPSMIQINSSHEEVFSNIQAFMAYRKKLNSKDNIRTYCQRNAADKPSYSCCRIDAVGHRVISTQAEEQYQKEHYDDTPKKEFITTNSKSKRSAAGKEASSRQLIQGQCQKTMQGSDNVSPVMSPENQGRQRGSLLQESTVTKHISLDKDTDIPFGVRERLLIVEDHLGVKPVGPNGDVFARMKLIEDRILRIEDDCEEYLKMKNYFRKDVLSKTKNPVHSTHERNTDCNKTKIFSIEDIDEKIMSLKTQLSTLVRNNDSDMSEDEENS